MKGCFIYIVLLLLNTQAFADDWHFKYIDNFDDALNSIDYGINDNLPKRQYFGQWEGTSWERRDGSWYDKESNPEWLSQVNHIYTPNKLSFHLEYSSVMLNYRIWPGSANSYRVSYKTDPYKNDGTSSMWTSFMLDSDSTKRGYVTQSNFGFLIRSNGGVGVYQNGNAKTVSGYIPASDTYEVVLDIKPGLLEATINGTVITAVLDEPLPASAHPYLGAYINPNSGAVSWFDDLVIKTRRGVDSGHLKYYGYYWADSPTYGSHLDEVAEFTNFNFIALSPDQIELLSSQYFRDRCFPNRCILQVRWEFWPWTSGHSNFGMLSPTWQSQWENIKNVIKANDNESLLAALYIVDEPFWAVNIALEDYETVLSQVKQDFPSLPIMAAFAYTSVDDVLPFVEGLDWVAANKYVAYQEFYEIEEMQVALQDQQPGKPIFVIPQSHFSGTTSDADVARINWLYYELALGNNNAIGIFNFGLWTHVAPEDIPVTRAVQRFIGEAIVSH